MNKIIFLYKADKINLNASAIRAESTINGFKENHIDTININLFSKNKLIALVIYMKYIFIQLITRHALYVYGDTKAPLLYLISKFSKYVIIERTELPYYMIDDKVTENKSDMYFYKLCKNANLFVVCSDCLGDFYKKMAPNAEFITIPIIYDKKHIAEFTADKKDIFKIGYCGYMGNDKDGIEDLILAISELKLKTNIEVLVKLYGYAEKEVIDYYNNLLIKLNLIDIVKFEGQIPKSKVFFVLSETDLLILTRPDNLQAKYGFPSKLIDYIETNKPIVCTNVGEIKKVFNEGEMTFCEPGNIDDIKDTILYVIENYDECKIKSDFALKRLNDFTSKNQVGRIIEKVNV